MRTTRARSIFRSRALTVVAVESAESSASRSSRGCRLHATLEPIAIVVRGPDASHALDLDGKRIDLERLRRAHPALETEIERALADGDDGNASSG